MNKKQRLFDGKLVLDYQNGSKKALTLLVKNWHQSFCSKAYWLVKDADVAKDIAQDSWGVIINKIDNLKNPESFGSWASRIVYTKSLDWLKNNKRIRDNLETLKHEEEILESEEHNSEEIKSKLLQTIKTLSKNQQTVIKLFYVEDYSLKEISGILNISVGTAKSRLFHAREKLKQLIKHRDYEN